jgi:hypothetical protein
MRARKLGSGPLGAQAVERMLGRRLKCIVVSRLIFLRLLQLARHSLAAAGRRLAFLRLLFPLSRTTANCER